MASTADSSEASDAESAGRSETGPAGAATLVAAEGVAGAADVPALSGEGLDSILRLS
jgi:hypothetical protein